MALNCTHWAQKKGILEKWNTGRTKKLLLSKTRTGANSNVPTFQHSIVPTTKEGGFLIQNKIVKTLKSIKMKMIKMRTNLVLVAALLLGLNLSALAQQGNGRGNQSGGQRGYYCENIPDLTEDQLSQIQTLRTAHWKEMQNFRNDLGKKRARLRTLQTAENANPDEINNLIEEMGTTRINMQKKAIKQRTEIRRLLTDNQKVYFDSRMGRRSGMGKCYGSNYGKGGGNGRGR